MHISNWFYRSYFPLRSTKGSKFKENILCKNGLKFVCKCLVTGQWFSPGTLVSSTNKTDRHDIAEILLKVTLSTINQTNQTIYSNSLSILCLLLDQCILPVVREITHKNAWFYNQIRNVQKGILIIHGHFMLYMWSWSFKMAIQQSYSYIRPLPPKSKSGQIWDGLRL